MLNNPREQALKGGFLKALDDAVMDSSAVHFNLMKQIMNDKATAANFGRVVLDIVMMKGVRGRGFKMQP